ncbi:MAG: hypothetical protein KDA20_12725 [Phycisphaerales bacterium]|nr:hypothetical protein [Phycisphaerales bacterium]
MLRKSYAFGLALSASPPILPEYLTELGFTSFKSYVQYVQGLDQSDREVHSAQILTSYVIWGE